MDNKKQLKRSEVAEQFKWAISDLFQTDEEWKEEYELTKKLISKVSDYQGRLWESADTLLEFYKLEDEIAGHFERVYVYANQRYHEDTSNSTYQDFPIRQVFWKLC